ncbi:ATP-dependent RNA helicase p62-like [Pectinophora gossypiella]|uniref:ATP-dependent RNA helicase p62-like n=1 Tax=Pectinophora gossypiella TaxID=13191 RepID=UPI00214EB61C|nr:ATP-dependent RNA helicase p62-like [Pectinophora gossypiella]
MMSLNPIVKLLRRKELTKVLYQNVYQYTRDTSLINSFKNVGLHFSGSSTIPRHIRTVCSQRFYSVKPAAQKEDDSYRNEHNVTVIGDEIPSPYTEIDSSGFPDYIKNYLKKQQIIKPTVIQAQGWPIALSGQNFVGVAQTGTGKTLAFLLPAAVHIKETQGRKGRGPRVLVLAPTRELARQIEVVAKDLEKLLNIRCVCIYGGVSRNSQMADLQPGVDILIATPGRLNDFIVSKTVSLSRCTYVVLDEADRMLDMGFEPQIRQALEGVPLERQILMFSATWPKEVQHLAKDYLGDFVQVNVGSTELSANRNIEQLFHFCDDYNKLEKFKSIMHNISGEGFGKILVFANTKKFVDKLTLMLRRNGWPAVGIHGDKTQAQRDTIIQKFRSGSTNILVATDVAARGLDVDGVTHVINYDFPNTSEDYIHRIGRTGRQDNKGVSHTLLTSEDERQAKNIIAVLKEANQEVPQDLEDMARRYNSVKAYEQQEKYKQRQNSWNSNKRWNKFRAPRQNTKFRY